MNPSKNNDRKRPSDRTIAFAVAVVQSKPDELSVREYIQLLRQHVAKGRRENAISSAYRHLDRSSYWHAEYERLKGVLQSTEGENVDLKREVDVLKGKLDSARQVSPVKKRKKYDEDVVPVPRSPKKQKQTHDVVKSAGDVFEVYEEVEFSVYGEAGNMLMRSLYQVHMQLKNRNRTEATVLAQHLMRAAAALSQVVQQAIQHHVSSGSSTIEDLKAVMSTMGRSFLSLMTGFNRLNNLVNGPETLGHVIYAFVHMYGKLVDCFRDLSVSEVRKAIAAESRAATGKKPPTSKTKIKQPRLLNVKDNVSLNIMTTFLCSAIANLDPKIDSHTALFEGFAFVALKQLGSKVYTLVFGHDRGETIEDEIVISEQPDEIEDGPEKPEDIQLRAAKLEAPYLIHLLTRIMNDAPAHQGATMSSKTGKLKQANNRGSMKGALAIAAKERLQRTLVNSIFGSEGADESDPFMDCLKMPVVNGPALSMPKVKEVDVQEWFKEEVWRLLGWEILSREGDW